MRKIGIFLAVRLEDCGAHCRPTPGYLLSLVLSAHRKTLCSGWIYTTITAEGYALLCNLSLVGRSPALPTSVSVAGAKVRRIFELSKFIVLKK